MWVRKKKTRPIKKVLARSTPVMYLILMNSATNKAAETVNVIKLSDSKGNWVRYETAIGCEVASIHNNHGARVFVPVSVARKQAAELARSGWVAQTVK